MSVGLPPVPALIPIALLRGAAGAGGASRPAAPRSRRQRPQPTTTTTNDGDAADATTTTTTETITIDSERSRGSSAAPEPPQSRRARSERHRKSERRREHHRRKPTRRRPSETRETSSTTSSTGNDSVDAATTATAETPANPRVNPIFVWIRQEDTRIVDVKCEDYDKRNRIVLTKTAHGWRAIPRTETLVPTALRATPDKRHRHHHHHNSATSSNTNNSRTSRKTRKASTKIRRKSAAVQVDGDEMLQNNNNNNNEDDDEEEVIPAAAAAAASSTSSPSPPPPPPEWTSPVNIESHLPSHKILVPGKCPSPSPDAEPQSVVVNSVVRGNCAQTHPEECSDATTTKVCDVTPLDNLLAVAEFEFNQHMQNGEWGKADLEPEPQNEIDESTNNNNNEEEDDEDNDDDDDEEGQKEFIDNIEQLNNLIESACSKGEQETEVVSRKDDDDQQPAKTDECDYTEDDDNNLAMDDILSRLEQSLRSPECSELGDVLLNECESSFASKIEDMKDVDCFTNENSYKTVPDLDNYFDESEDNNNKDDDDEEEEQKTEPQQEQQQQQPDLLLIKQDQPPVKKSSPEHIVESSTVLEDEPTDLSIKSKYADDEIINLDTSPEEPDLPTDLSVPKDLTVRSSPPLRSPSQNSEAIQSPQPSGIPAVPPSPDIVSTSANNNNCTTTNNNNNNNNSNNNNNKSKSVFLESLLTTTSQKIALNSEVTIIKQKEPLDLGKCRKSASPTVTCSEEVKNNQVNSEPPSKKFKAENITLKTLLDVDVSTKQQQQQPQQQQQQQQQQNEAEKVPTPETPRLLELLKTDCSNSNSSSTGPDPLGQLRQLLRDSSLNVPDPMLVPKERLSQIISNPGREIPRLLKQRPELRLPEALAFPHLLQDPDILVITLQQLETIIYKQNQSLNLKEVKLPSPGNKTEKSSSHGGSNHHNTHHHNHNNNNNNNNNNNSHSISNNHHHNNNNNNNHNSSSSSSGNSRRHEKESSQNKKKISAASDEPLSKSNSILEPASKSGFNELANDIDAATTAAFNQMIWLPYLNQLEAMSFGNSPDMMKMLANTFPTYPGQSAELNHLMGVGRFPPPLGFPLQSPLNYNNQLEMSMWQEAMLQANMLRPKNPFDGLNSKNSFRDYLDKLNFAAATTNKGPTMNSSSSNSNSSSSKGHLMAKQNLTTNLFPGAGDLSSRNSAYHNSFMNLPNTYLPNSQKQSLQMPHYGPLFAPQKSQSKSHSLQYLSKHGGSKASQALYHQSHHHNQRVDEKHQHQQQQQQQQQQHHHQLHQQLQQHHHQQQLARKEAEARPRLSCKPFANATFRHCSTEPREKTADFSKHQPIDLSGSTAPTTGKLKVKQHLIDPTNAPKLLKHDDVPEVGSTTASVEEMQDAHKHLWHPLFGNQKGYHSPWNWTTVTAAGE